MPNHVHGIIVINASEIRDAVVMTQHAASLHNDQNQPPNPTWQKKLPKPGSISAIVRSYESAVTRWAGQNSNPEFRWQAGFFDRIIRDESSLAIVRAYIIENPNKWDMDDNYSSTNV